MEYKPEDTMAFVQITVNPPEPNFELAMGEEPNNFRFHFRVNKTLRNRIKYWLFCRFFPFKIRKWDKETR